MVPPIGIRQLMDSWSFAEAKASMQEANDILTFRDKLIQRAGALQMVPPPPSKRSTRKAQNQRLASLRRLPPLTMVYSHASASGDPMSSRSWLPPVPILRTTIFSLRERPRIRSSRRSTVPDPLAFSERFSQVLPLEDCSLPS